MPLSIMQWRFTSDEGEWWDDDLGVGSRILQVPGRWCHGEVVVVTPHEQVPEGQTVPQTQPHVVPAGHGSEEQ